MAAYKNSEVAKKSHSTHTVYSTADSKVPSSSTSSDSDDSNFDEVAVTMASFSIEGLLGLGKDNEQNDSGDGADKNKKKSGEGSSAAEQAASKDENGGSASEDATTNAKPTPQQQDKDVNGEPSGLGAAANDNADEDAKETLHESEHEHEENSTELVTVDVWTMHSSRSVSRSSSRKRKRTMGEPSHKGTKEQQRQSTPESDAEPGRRNTKEKLPKPSGSKPPGSTKRLRTAFSASQLSALEIAFRISPYPDTYGKEQIAILTGISETKVQVWFQNRRARYRKREMPLEAQKPLAAAVSNPAQQSAMLQAYLTALALHQGGIRPPNAPGPSVPQQFYAPGGPFYATGFAAMPAAAPYPHPGYYPYPVPTSTPMAAAAQTQGNANKKTQESEEEEQ